MIFPWSIQSAIRAVIVAPVAVAFGGRRGQSQTQIWDQNETCRDTREGIAREMRIVCGGRGASFVGTNRPDWRQNRAGR